MPAKFNQTKLVMRKNLLILLVAVASVAHAQVLAPSASPSATVSTVVGLTDVKVEYARPKARGRKIFGAGAEYLVPYGKMWRTAANSGSRITFSDDVKIGGSTVPKGTYQLISTPGATEWTVIFSKDMSLGSNPANYNATNDVAKVTVKPQRLSEAVEMFTIEIADVAENSKTANIQIAWENTSVKVPIEVDFDEKVMKSIEASTKVSPNNLFQAANYYLENGKDLKQASAWINEACAANPNAYWMTHVKAKIMKQMGDKKGATEAATASRAAAEKANNADYVKMNDELLKSLK